MALFDILEAMPMSLRRESRKRPFSSWNLSDCIDRMMRVEDDLNREVTRMIGAAVPSLLHPSPQLKFFVHDEDSPAKRLRFLKGQVPTLTRTCENCTNNKLVKPTTNEEQGEVALTNGKQMVTTENKPFEVNLAVQDFKPDEVSVQIKDGHLVVQARHETGDEKKGNYVFRQMYKRFSIPDNVDVSKMSSFFSNKGKLSIEAPLLTEDTPEVKKIPITIETESSEENGVAEEKNAVNESVKE